MSTKEARWYSPSSQVGEGVNTQNDPFFRQYTSRAELRKYTKNTAGFGIDYLLDHDYKAVYLNAMGYLPQPRREQGVRILEFGCGGGMNLLHLVSTLGREWVKIANAVGSDFSPVMIEEARREARSCLREEEQSRVQFCVAKNESLIADLSSALGKSASELRNSFDFIVGVNTVRYCHDAKTEIGNARDLFDLLVPGGICVVIDMNNRFLFFRSDLRNRFRLRKEKQCYVPSLEEYAAPFVRGGFEVLRKEHFCWIPHSSGRLRCYLLRTMSPVLNLTAKSRAMRSLVVARKPC